MGQWILHTSEILSVLDKENIEPWLGSPFLRLGPPEKTSQSANPVQDRDGLLKALSVISRPESVMGLVNYPPEDPELSWFYGKSEEEDVALYKQKTDREEHLIVWPLNARDIYENFVSSLDLYHPVNPEDFSFKLTKDSFATLAAIVDIIQEDSLVAFLSRDNPPESSFNAQELLSCFYRSLQGSDLRWMSQRVRLISPVSLSPTIEDINSELNEFVKKKYVKKENDRFRLSRDFAIVTSMLSDCSGFAALSIRESLSSASGQKTWNHLHIASARGLESLWLFEFSKITRDDFSLELKEISPAFLQQYLRTLVFPKEKKGKSALKPGISKKPVPPPPPSERIPEIPKQSKISEETLKFCRHCGVKLRPQASFCTSCGKKVKAVPSVRPAPRSSSSSSQSVCPKCGSKVLKGKKFCKNCGAKLT